MGEAVDSKGAERIWKEAHAASVDALLHITNDDAHELAQRHIREPPPRGGARVEHEQREDRLEAEADAEIMRQVLNMDTETPRLKKAAAVRALLRRDDQPVPGPALEYDDGDWGWETRGERVAYGPEDWDPSLRRSEESKASSQQHPNDSQHAAHDQIPATPAMATLTREERLRPTGRIAVSLARPSPFPRGDSDDEAEAGVDTGPGFSALEMGSRRKAPCYTPLAPPHAAAPVKNRRMWTRGARPALPEAELLTEKCPMLLGVSLPFPDYDDSGRN